MIKIKMAKEADSEVLALLGSITYTESHSQYIDNENDLKAYNNEVFSVSKTKDEIKDSKNLFYIIYADDLPVGYSKLILNAANENVHSQSSCKLERIYILNSFIPLKLGQQLLTFIEDKAKELLFDTMWLSVYIKNNRAIKFYRKNAFKDIGKLNFLVNGKEYENIVFSKKL